VEPAICIVNNGRDGWYIYDVEFTIEPLGGSCSLMHCADEDLVWQKLKNGLPICDERGIKIRN